MRVKEKKTEEYVKFLWSENRNANHIFLRAADFITLSLDINSSSHKR